VNDPTRRGNAGRTEPEATESDVGRLIVEAGPRPGAPPERLARIRAAAREEWLRQAPPQDRPAPRRAPWIPIALAAGLLLALGLALSGRRGGAPVPAPAPPTVATVELVRGTEPGFGTGDELVAGSWIETGSGPAAGPVALRLSGGSSLRIDVGTRVRLVSNREVELESGAVYLDSDGAAASSPPLEVATPFGRVTEIGTRFEVRLDAAEGSALDVRVRDGRVVLAEDSKAHEIARGEALRLGADGETERRSIDPRGAEWDWALAAAPAPEIEGQTLVEFLAWLARETGWTIRLEGAELAGSVAGIRLHGSVEGLAPPEAAEVVLTGAGLEHRLEERTPVIRRP